MERLERIAKEYMQTDTSLTKEIIENGAYVTATKVRRKVEMKADSPKLAPDFLKRDKISSSSRS